MYDEMLTRLSIKAKLITLVAVLLLALTATGTFAVIEMRAINTAAQDIKTNWLPSIRLVSELRTQSARYRAVLRDYLTEPEEAFMADIQRNLDARAKDYETANKAYAPRISSPEEAALYQELAQTWTTFRAAADEVVAHARKHEVAQARAVNATRATPAGRKMDAVMTKIVALNDNGATHSGQNDESAYATAFGVLLAVLSGMVLLGLAAAVLVVSETMLRRLDVARPLRVVAASRCGGDPAMPGIAPIAAARKLLAAGSIAPEAIAVAEIMEAFAAQAIACAEGIGVAETALNRSGGGLARGHPIGASGAILTVRLWHEMQREAAGALGLAAIAAAGGLGSALLVTI